MANYTPLTGNVTLSADGVTILITCTGVGSFVGPIATTGALTGFSATVGGNAATLTSAQRGTNTSTIALVLASPVNSTAAVAVSYTAGTVINDSTPVTPLTLGTMTNVAVSTNNSTVSPSFTKNALSVDTTGLNLTMTFTGNNGNIANAGNVTTGFALKVNGTTRTLAAANASSTTTLVLTVSAANKILVGDVVTLTYTTGLVQDASTAILAPFTAAAVTNNSTVTGVTMATAVVATDGKSIALTFTGATGNIVNSGNSVTGFVVKVGSSSGSRQILAKAVTPSTTTATITFTDERITKNSTVTVAYTGGGPLVDSAGTANRLQVQTALTSTNSSNYLATGRTITLATPKIYYSIDGINFYEIGDYTPFTTSNVNPITRYSATGLYGVDAAGGGIDTSITSTPGNAGNGNAVTVGANSGDDIVSYQWNRKTPINSISSATAKKSGQMFLFEIGRLTTNPVTFKFTCADPDVDLYYTFNNRAPHASPAMAKNNWVTSSYANEITQKNPRSGKYDDTNRPVLYENTAGDNTTIKVRAYKKHNSLASKVNSNIMSKIIKAKVKITGGTTANNTYKTTKGG